MILHVQNHFSTWTEFDCFYKIFSVRLSGIYAVDVLVGIKMKSDLLRVFTRCDNRDLAQ